MSVLRWLKRGAFGDLRRAFMGVHADMNAINDHILQLLGAQSAIALRGLDSVTTLSDAGFCVSSQWDEDGIIEWLLQKIPFSRPMFVEFGVSDYKEANTRFLLRNRNWKGLVMDGSVELIDRIRREPDSWKHDLTAKADWISAENINALISDAGFRDRIGLLSVDIDGNDYWVWQAIDVVNPDIVICEYQAVFGDIFPVSIPYRADFSRFDAHPSGIYFGCSIAALEYLAGKKGYRLVGSNRAGNNAFFVRNDLFSHVSGRIAVTKARPSLYRDASDGDGGFANVAGQSRAALIGDMPVVRVDTGEIVKLNALGDLYSTEWRRDMGL